jgi:hypothetical protein
MKLGLPVTWDNPDIELLRNAVVVPEHDLLPSTLYEIRARIWNNSYNAPVFGMPVEFSYLSFGVGTTSTAIGSTLVNVGVKGGPGHPSTTIIPWVAPPVAGHYCLQVKLDWVDDSNPDNNLGQNNLDVAAAHSPAHFTFQLRNAFTETRHYTFKVDIYSPLPVPDCGAVILSKNSRSARTKDVVARYSSMKLGACVRLGRCDHAQ